MDKKSNAPIPYATIQFSDDQGIITNEEGRFSITFEDNISKNDSIHISSMGYEKISISVQSPIDSVLYLAPKAIELGGVFVTNKNLTVDEIITNVKERISQL